MNNPEYEYQTRGQNPLYDKSGHARDIDVIGVSHTSGICSYVVDNIAFDNASVSVWNEGDDWWLRSIENDFAEQLHPDVMTPVKGIGASGLIAATVPLQTHISLTLVRGKNRRKDDVAIGLLQQASQSNPRPLPDTLYKPFRDLMALQHDIPTAKLKYMYRRFIPEKAKCAMDPVLEKIGKIAASGLHEAR